jgi:uncharacterized membrane protein YgcG
MVSKILSAFVGLILFFLTAHAADARSLYWQDLNVQAHLDRDGRLHIRERQIMVFDGDWNGGERRFSVRPGQTFHFERLLRLDPVSGSPRELTEGPLTLVDNYGWQDDNTLRWRSRLPTDPPFSNTTITYILEYSLARIITRNGDSYTLDHDFAFPDRAGIIKNIMLNLDLDPAWQADESSSLHREIKDLPPGQGLVLNLKLRHATGDPQEIAAGEAAPTRFETAPPPAPWWLGLALATLASIACIFFATRFLLHEQRMGRFRPLPPLASISREWLKDHVLHLRPEVVGAAWDKRTSQSEVAAVIARLVQEGRIESRVEEFILPFFNIRIARFAVLHMTLKKPRSSFAGYERKLIDGLFIAGDSTDTRAIRKYYSSKQKPFNPAAELAEPLEKEVNQLTEDTKHPLSYFWAPASLLAAIGFFSLLANAFIHQYELPLEITSLVLLAVLWTLGVIFALMTRNSSDARVLNVLRLFFPPVMICVGYAILTNQAISMLMTIGLFFFAAAALQNIFSLAKTRDSLDGVLLCQQLTAARKYFSRELRKPQPDIDDSWFPYLMAFGLGEQVDSWFSRYSGSAQFASAGGASGGGSAGFTGGGGLFGGGGASGAWMAAAGAMAAGSSSSSSGGGGGSSGGGGGGGW